MIEINGKSVYNSLAMGRLFFLNKEKDPIKRIKIENIADEVQRLESARDSAKAELQELYQKALVSVGESNAEVFQIHIMMLEDEDFFGAMTSMINLQSINAEFAVAHTADIFAETFGSMADEYMKARATDVKDISERLIKNLLGGESKMEQLTENSIIVAPDLTPSETVQLDLDKVSGFVTFFGSQTSHTSIIARTMNLPAVICTGEISSEYHGRTAILDGSSGTIYIDPDNDKIEDFKHRKKLEEERTALLREQCGKPTETKSGKSVKLYANIAYPRDLRAVLANDSEGIGLFRSEFLYLENQDYPSEDQQFERYKEVAEAMGQKQVIIRTLDIGADKKIDYFNLPFEDNPALGFRAIRICLADRALFKTQLRAILRASVYGNISIMFPMIISQSEVTAAKSCLKECMQELEGEGIPYNPEIQVGIMIETPAAAIISDLLAREVDFFSIGTNDLTQYTLAADRQNSHVEEFVDIRHEAIMRLIELTIQNAHKEGIWVGICGELATDSELCKRFVEMGVDELSVTPSEVLRVRERIRNIE